MGGLCSQYPVENTASRQSVGWDGVTVHKNDWWSQSVICYIQITERHPFWECLHSCEHLLHVVLVFRFDSLVLFSVFQRNDIAMAITKFDQFDFLIDIVPRDDLKPPKRQVRKREELQAVKIDRCLQYIYFYILQRLWREECAVLCLAAWGRCKHPWLEAGCWVCEGFQSDVCSALLPLSLHNQMSKLLISFVYFMNVAIAPCAWLKKQKTWLAGWEIHLFAYQSLRSFTNYSC